MATLWNEDALIQDAVARLKASLCPEKYQYTHEFLDMAAAAATRESVSAEVPNPSDPASELVKASLLN